MFLILSISSCAGPSKGGLFGNSGVQIVDMGEMKGFKIIEIATLRYPDDDTTSNQAEIFLVKNSELSVSTEGAFTADDKDNFSQSLMLSLRSSDVKVLDSAQTKLHINFSRISLANKGRNKVMVFVADVSVSRNGMTTKQKIEVMGKAKVTLSSTKADGVKTFLQEVGKLLSEQSAFKR
jgi:hypothetical protein